MTYLIVDDEIEICNLFVKAFSENNKVHTANTGARALELFKAESPEIVVLDLQLPDMSGIEVLRRIKSVSPGAVVIMLTAYGSADNTVEAMRLGAYEFINKPFELAYMRTILEKAANPVRKLGKTQPADSLEENLLIGKTPRMREIYKTIGRMADSEATVLISGETGTGKELVARTIHYSGQRRNGPFIPVDCVSLSRSLLESELFGYEKGAFTGANASRKGMIEVAANGTLFLDEIGNLELETQAKLLRVIQEKKITRVGSTAPIDINIRIIAAVNRNPEMAVKEGTLRKDFYYRLNVIPITIPPLRERQGDIPLLAKHFLEIYTRGREKKGLDDNVMEALSKHKWPGNVRELKNVIERLISTSPNPVIELDYLPTEISHLGTPATAEKDAPTFNGKVQEFEKNLLLRALRENNGSQTKAAEQLKMSVRSIRHYIQKYKLK